MLHKVWLVALFCVCAVLLVLFGAPKLLPDTLELETSVNVDAPVEHVFQVLERPQRWIAWSGWVPQGAEPKIAGPEHGPGAVLYWKREGKTETLRIAKTEPPAAVFYELLQEDEVLFAGVLRLAGEGERTHVVWRHSGAFGAGYFQPIVLFFIRDRVAASLHAALDKLRALAETGN